MHVQPRVNLGSACSISQRSSPISTLQQPPRLSSLLIVLLTNVLFNFLDLICIYASMFNCRGRYLEVSSLKFGESSHAFYVIRSFLENHTRQDINVKTVIVLTDAINKGI